MMHLLERAREAAKQGLLEGRCGCEMRDSNGRFMAHEVWCGWRAVQDLMAPPPPPKPRPTPEPHTRIMCGEHDHYFYGCHPNELPEHWLEMVCWECHGDDFYPDREPNYLSHDHEPTR